jgi:6,7-dimethyl-8-ribityllumazine synthase
MSQFQGRWSHEGQARIAIIVSRFNQNISQALLDGAIDTLARLGVPSEDIDTIWVPGAFEIPGMARRIAPRYDALITLGAVIRGETAHFEYVAGSCAQGIAALAQEGKTPVIFGVLTCNTTEEAQARAGGKAGNKGGEAALAALEMLSLHRQLPGA